MCSGASVVWLSVSRLAYPRAEYVVKEQEKQPVLALQSGVVGLYIIHMLKTRTYINSLRVWPQIRCLFQLALE